MTHIQTKYTKNRYFTDKKIMNNNANIKTNASQALRVVAFVLTFLILLESLSLSIFSGRNAAKFNPKLRDAYSFVEEPQNSIQIAGIGNSNLYSGFVPFSMWSECGYTSTICASPSQSIRQSEALLKKVYKTQKPKLIIIETDMFYDNLVQKDGRAAIKKANINAFLNRMNPKKFEDGVPQIFSIFTFHNRWKKQKLESIQNSFLHTHGYRYNNTIYELKVEQYMIPTQESEPIPWRNKKEIDRIIDMCTKEGSQILFITIPSTSAWNYERHNAVEKYAKENNIRYIDMNLLCKDANINLDNAFRDNGKHLNYYSADKLTRYVANFIRQNYDIECRTNNPDYAKWDEECNNFYRQCNSINV